MEISLHLKMLAVFSHKCLFKKDSDGSVQTPKGILLYEKRSGISAKVSLSTTYLFIEQIQKEMTAIKWKLQTVRPNSY